MIEPKAMKREEFLAEARSGAFDGVKTIYRTFGSGLKTGRIDEEVLAALPDSVKFISHNGKSNSSSCARVVLQSSIFTHQAQF